MELKREEKKNKENKVWFHFQNKKKCLFDSFRNMFQGIFQKGVHFLENILKFFKFQN